LFKDLILFRADNPWTSLIFSEIYEEIQNYPVKINESFFKAARLCRDLTTFSMATSVISLHLDKQIENFL